MDPNGWMNRLRKGVRLRGAFEQSWVGYAVAVGAVLAAVANLALLRTNAPVASFCLAVIVTTWLAGWRPGLLAVALATFALSEYFAPGTERPEAGDVSRIGYFLAITLFIVWVVAQERRSQGRLRRAIDMVPTMGWSLHADGSLEFVNRRWLEYTGMSRKDALSRPLETIHPDDCPLAIDKWQAVMAAKSNYEMEMRLRAADGSYRWFLVRTAPLLDAKGRVLRWYGISTDIEDRKRADAALRDYADRLERLSRRQLEVHEEERKRLAVELHDEFAQLLATINMHLHAVRKRAGESVQERLDESISLVDLAGEQMRNLALELRPTMLDSAGLEKTLRWLAEQHERRTGMRTHVLGHIGNPRPAAAMACFRIVQQALTNVVQHAHAKNVWIDLAETADALTIDVRDDGRGFDVQATLEHAARRGHFGLLGMRERAQLAAGSLEIESVPGSGTRLGLALPRNA